MWKISSNTYVRKWLAIDSIVLSYLYAHIYFITFLLSKILLNLTNTLSWFSLSWTLEFGQWIDHFINGDWNWYFVVIKDILAIFIKTNYSTENIQVIKIRIWVDNFYESGPKTIYTNFLRFEVWLSSKRAHILKLLSTFFEDRQKCKLEVWHSVKLCNFILSFDLKNEQNSYVNFYVLGRIMLLLQFPSDFAELKFFSEKTRKNKKKRTVNIKQFM